MPRLAAVPFTLKRSSDLWTRDSYETTTETAHGLVRLEAGRLVVQWRRAVRTESMGAEAYRTKEEIDPVREIVIPIDRVAGAVVPRRRWFGLLRSPRLVIAAADLAAFEEIAGRHGLKLKHPAKLELRIRRADRLIAEEFAAELALAVAARLPPPAGAPDSAAFPRSATTERGELPAPPAQPET